MLGTPYVWQLYTTMTVEHSEESIIIICCHLRPVRISVISAESHFLKDGAPPQIIRTIRSYWMKFLLSNCLENVDPRLTSRIIQLNPTGHFFWEFLKDQGSWTSVPTSNEVLKNNNGNQNCQSDNFLRLFWKI